MSSIPNDLGATTSLGYNVLQTFFHALTKGEELLTASERSEFDVLRIPETIFYNFGKPIERYATDFKKGCVTRKEGRMTTEGIWDEFSLSQCPLTKRSALWISEPSEATGDLSQMKDIQVDIHCQEPGQHSLRVFLQHLKGKGLLQQVVECKRESDGGARSIIFLCHFSQHKLSVDKFTSDYQVAGPGGSESPPPPSQIFSPHYGTYRTTTVPSSSKLYAQLKSHSKRIALCISRFYGAKVVTMSLGFRFDANETLYFSWCDSVTMCSMTPGGPRTYTSDTFGTRLVPTHTEVSVQKDTKFSLIDHRAALQPCSVCHEIFERGGMCRVHLRWLLMAVSLMDKYVKGWVGEVPPSVALVCPDLTLEGFRALQATVTREPRFELICGSCFDRSEWAIHYMTTNRINAPPWLGVDSTQRNSTLTVFLSHTEARFTNEKYSIWSGRRGPNGAVEGVPLYRHFEGRWETWSGTVEQLLKLKKQPSCQKIKIREEIFDFELCREKLSLIPISLDGRLLPRSQLLTLVEPQTPHPSPE
eukprot:GILI01020636.1.p1 GENE.GILI01020636.1~~GILI01020636.1.p1  ORF type:complete len:531 (+),score=-1.69 GILI01020636.1:32-1624(+)